MPLLDIGAGYGMLKEFVEQSTALKYYGVDVYPKFDGVLKVENGSTLPPEIMSMQFGVVASLNVFQHLSIAQRRHYMEQVQKILIPNLGVFTVTISLMHPQNPRFKGFVCKETGKQYMCHYGQYTEVQGVQEFINDLVKHFNILSFSERCDGSYTFNCSAKELDKTPVV